MKPCKAAYAFRRNSSGFILEYNPEYQAFLLKTSGIESADETCTSANKTLHLHTSYRRPVRLWRVTLNGRDVTFYYFFNSITIH
jgi:hypothetical protein